MQKKLFQPQYLTLKPKKMPKFNPNWDFSPNVRSNEYTQNLFIKKWEAEKKREDRQYQCEEKKWKRLQEEKKIKRKLSIGVQIALFLEKF